MAKFLKNNWFFFTMIIGIVAGCLVGAFWKGASVLEPLGTLFINLMFCVVVPMVFFSISSSIANMKSAKRAGKLMGTTVLTFMCTTIIASCPSWSASSPCTSATRSLRPRRKRP